MDRELTEEELESIVGGIPQEIAEEMAKDVIYDEEQKSALDEMFEADLEKIKAGMPLDNEGHRVK